MTNCDICLYPKGKIKEFKCFQPTLNKYENHRVCEKCLKNLVENYFNLTNVL